MMKTGGNQAKEVRKEVYFSHEEWESILAALPRGAKPGPFIREVAIRAARESAPSSEVEEYDEVPLLGTIAGGPGICVIEAPPGAMCPAPIAGLPPDVYALWVQGDSMQSLNGSSIPDGSYAFFRPDSHPSPGAVVHVEWEVTTDDRCHCSLKKWEPNYDKQEATFIPFNKTHKPFVRKFGEFNIKGVFLRHYKEKA